MTRLRSSEDAVSRPIRRSSSKASRRGATPSSFHFYVTNRDHRPVLRHRRRHDARRACSRWDSIPSGCARCLRGSGWTASRCASSACCARGSRARRSTSTSRRSRTGGTSRRFVRWSPPPASPMLVRERADAAFTAIADAEGEIHGVGPEKVHLHEVGAVDAILDVVGSVWGLTLLGVDRVYCGPIVVGDGTVKAAHGILPVPAPATLKLLEGHVIRPGPEGRGRARDAHRCGARARAVERSRARVVHAAAQRLRSGDEGVCESGERASHHARGARDAQRSDRRNARAARDRRRRHGWGGAERARRRAARGRRARCGAARHADEEGAPGHAGGGVVRSRRVRIRSSAHCSLHSSSIGIRRSTIERHALPREEWTVLVQGEAIRMKRVALPGGGSRVEAGVRRCAPSGDAPRALAARRVRGSARGGGTARDTECTFAGGEDRAGEQPLRRRVDDPLEFMHGARTRRFGDRCVAVDRAEQRKDGRTRTGGVVLDRDGQAGRGEVRGERARDRADRAASRRTCRSGSRAPSRRSRRTSRSSSNNQAGHDYVLAQALVRWTVQFPESTTVNKGSIGYVDGKDQSIDLLAATDTLLTSVEKSNPDCAAEVGRLSARCDASARDPRLER